MDTPSLSLQSGASRNRLILFALWLLFYSSLTLLTPPLLDDADSVHAEVAREMLLRHDWVTLYANGIRYLEKAPLLYWSIAASFKLFGIRTAAARLPLAFTVLALALILEAFARRAFSSPEPSRSSLERPESATRAGLYAGLILLSSFGIFIFTRIIIPDAMVCLWLTLALFCYWLTENNPTPQSNSNPNPNPNPLLCWAFAACCALNVLTKGLIGIVFPILIVLAHLALTRRNARAVLTRISQLAPISSTIIFFAIAAPWHILIAYANPTQGHPGNLTFTHGHWSVPLPTDGNVHGWLWFYFVNEHLLRYLNLRVPRDYDTVPLWLFWGLLLIWLMPFSAYLYQALHTIPWRKAFRPLVSIRTLTPQESTRLLLGLWAAIPLLFFSLSTRQEYYVLPSLPPLILLIAAWLNDEATEAESFAVPNPLTRSGQRISVVLLTLGSLAAIVATFFIFSAHTLHSQHRPRLAPQTKPRRLRPLLRPLPRPQHPGHGRLSRSAHPHRHRPLRRHPRQLAPPPQLQTPRRQPLAHRRHLHLPARRPHRPADLLPCPHLTPARRRHRTRTPPRRHHRHPRRIRERQHPRLLSPPPRRPTNPAHPRRPQLQSLVRQLLPRRPTHLRRQRLPLPQVDRHRRIFLWQDLSDPVPSLPGKTYFIAQSGGKEILSNQPNPY